MKDEKLLKKILEDNHYKITKPRLVIFWLLRKKGAQTLAELVKGSSDSVDRVSVYRIIELYEKLGVAKRITIGWKYRIELSDIFLDHHHHITCLSCHKVTAVKENHEIEQLIKEWGEKTGYHTISHQLELQGYCSECLQRDKSLTQIPRPHSTHQ